MEMSHLKCRIMYSPREIIYGFANSINPPHPKYLVSIYRDENLQVMACMTTSKNRAGVDASEIKPGPIKKNERFISYVFEAGCPVGKIPGSDKDFSFPLRTTIAFDYCWKIATLDDLNKQIENPQVVGIMNEKEYLDLVYALMKSPYTSRAIVPILDKILKDYYKDK